MKTKKMVEEIRDMSLDNLTLTDNIASQLEKLLGYNVVLKNMIKNLTERVENVESKLYTYNGYPYKNDKKETYWWERQATSSAPSTTISNNYVTDDDMISIMNVTPINMYSTSKSSDMLAEINDSDFVSFTIDSNNK